MFDQASVDPARRERAEQAAAVLLSEFRHWMEPALWVQLDQFWSRLQRDTTLPAISGTLTPVACSCGERFQRPDELDIHFANAFIPDDFTGATVRWYQALKQL